MSKGAKVALFVFLGFGFMGLLGLGTCVMCAGAAVSGMEESRQEREAQEVAQEAANLEQEKRVPWLATVRQNCNRYDTGANDIQKSAIFNENQQLIKGQSLSNVKGVLNTIITDHGGDEVSVSTKVGGAKFSAHGMAKNSNIYNSVSSLAEGQCVIFSGDVNDTRFDFSFAMGTAEKTRICAMVYEFRFSSISACPVE